MVRQGWSMSVRVSKSLGAYPSAARNLVLTSTGRLGDFLRDFDRFKRLHAGVRG